MKAKTFKEKYPDAFEHEHIAWAQHCEPDYEYLIEDFVQRMEALGIGTSVNDVEWTGFWSQGDGARFSGTVDPGKAFFDANPELWDDYGVIACLADSADLMDWLNIYTSQGNYYHRYTMSIDDSDFQNGFDLEWQGDNIVGGVMPEIDNGIYKGMPLDVAIALFSEADIDEFADTVLEICRGYANALHEELEAEYEWETGEERFMEFLDSFGFDYDADEEELNVH